VPPSTTLSPVPSSTPLGPATTTLSPVLSSITSVH